MSGSFFSAPRYCMPSIQPRSPKTRPVSTVLFRTALHMHIRETPPSLVSNRAISSVKGLLYLLAPGRLAGRSPRNPRPETDVYRLPVTPT